MLALKEALPSSAVDAEGTAIAALVYLAERPKELQRFLDLSGLNAGNVRAAAQQAEFLVGVLTHLVQWEPLLLDFAAETGRQPDSVAAAAAILGWPDRPRAA